MAEKWRRLTEPREEKKEPEQIGDFPAWFSAWLAQSGKERKTIGLIQNRGGTFTLDVDQQLLLVGAATAPTTGVGIFLGLNGSDYEFRVGDPAGSHLLWDGTNLLFVGTLNVRSGSGQNRHIFGVTGGDGGLYTIQDEQDDPVGTLRALSGDVRLAVEGGGDLILTNLDTGMSLILGTPQTYTPTNVTPDRSFDADATTTAELADVVGTLIADLQAAGLFD